MKSTKIRIDATKIRTRTIISPRMATKTIETHRHRPRGQEIWKLPRHKHANASNINNFSMVTNRFNKRREVNSLAWMKNSKRFVLCRERIRRTNRVQSRWHQANFITQRQQRVLKLENDRGMHFTLRFSMRFYRTWWSIERVHAGWHSA